MFRLDSPFYSSKVLCEGFEELKGGNKGLSQSEFLSLCQEGGRG